MERSEKRKTEGEGEREAKNGQRKKEMKGFLKWIKKNSPVFIEDREKRRGMQDGENSRRTRGLEDGGKKGERRGEEDISASAGDRDPRPIIPLMTIHNSKSTEAVQDQESGQATLEVLEQLLRDRSVGASGGGQEREQGQSHLLLEAWGRRNPVTGQEGGTGAGRYPQNWLHQYQQQVEEAVRLHFPSLPPENSPQQQLHTYLRQVQEVVQGELLRLAPVLKEAGLLATLIDKYHVHTMSQLELLLQKNLNTDQTFILLRWTLKTYLSNVLGHPDVAADVTGVMDMMLLADWLQKAKTKALQSAQEYVDSCLKRMLEREEEEEEEAGSCDQSDEEAFIRLHLDITQCLSNVVRTAGAVSPFLQMEMQRMCLTQLHIFIKGFIALEEKHMTGGKGAGGEKIPHLFRTINRELSCTASEEKCVTGEKGAGEERILPLFRTISTCRELRLLVVQLASEAQTDAAATVGLLEELHSRATQQLLHSAAHNVEVSLQRYFREDSIDLGEVLSDDLKVLFLYLSKEPDIQEDCLDTVYSQVVSLYLKHLLLGNQSHLERRWGNVGEAIKEDAEVLHEVFSQQNKDVENKSVLLLKVSSVLSFTNEETFPSTCNELLTHFPQVSREQVKKLILWKDRLSRQQVKAVLDTTTTESPWQRLFTVWRQCSRSVVSSV